MRRIAVYGGTFNPFGNQHLDALRMVAESGIFDSIIVVPSVAHPLKDSSEVLPFEHRYNMTVLGVQARHDAIPSFPARISISVSMAEIDILREQAGPVYTYRLLKHLQQSHYDEAKIMFVIGPDIFPELPKWKYVKEIRRDFGFYEIPNVGIHSTGIRDMLSRGVPTWTRYVPPLVSQYIKNHQLYHVERTLCTHEPRPTVPFAEVTGCVRCGMLLPIQVEPED